MSSWSRDPFTGPPAGRLLVVDGDPLVRRLLSLMLAGAYGVVEATNAHEAVGHALMDRPDLILLEPNLPVGEADGKGEGAPLARAAPLRPSRRRILRRCRRPSLPTGDQPGGVGPSQVF